ncbi:Ig-like domain-containing protein [Actinomycetospora termitidis]|uniref:Ig-like domain-containing protein n=1 Tax=Actinomycetospora termitidis TaxID=3053470 RepID=A0ABT7ME66_9PSEU|nr:Ig-like domain-containing protein [Actinomycetospora sp. Odt1-22]MDL5158960.1 Ig-like domain-containing protein [Actinomycetospora sp. Odt1-22]
MAAAIGAGVLLQGTPGTPGDQAVGMVVHTVAVTTSPAEETDDSASAPGGTPSESEAHEATTGDGRSAATTTESTGGGTGGSDGGGGSGGSTDEQQTSDDVVVDDGAASEAEPERSASPAEHDPVAPAGEPATVGAAGPTTSVSPPPTGRHDDAEPTTTAPAVTDPPVARPAPATARVGEIGSVGSAATTPAAEGTAATTAASSLDATSTSRVTRPVTENPLTRFALALVGIVPAAPRGGPGPLAPAAPTSALLIAQWALFRRGENSLFNRSPVADPVQLPPTTTGLVTGELHATDPDGDRLTYTVTRAPSHGHVTVDPSTGTYTYVPDPVWARTGGTDTFTITIRDNNPSAPGLGRFTGLAQQVLARSNPALAQRLFGAHTTTVTVPISITPANTAPSAPPVTPAPSTVDGSSGVVTGGLGVSDAEGDPLTFVGPSGPTAKGGTVIVDPTTGRYTYTPSPQARHAAARDGASAADATDTFTVVVSDGRGGTVPVTVTVPVVPVNAAPVSLTPGPSFQEDEETGVVTGAPLAVSDADGDTLSYSGPTSTTFKGGTVAVDPTTGSWTYTPSAQARHDAARDGATAADKEDTFTIVVTDAHGGTVPVTVSVPITPTNTTPSTSGSSVTSTDPTSGAVSGQVRVDDAESDTLAYAGPSGRTGKGGTVRVDPTSGNWTYTPSAQARHDAARDGASAADKTDNFTITVADGHGGVTSVNVTVDISGSNTAPAVGSVTVGVPNASTGAVSGGFTPGSDSDGDTVTYIGPSGTTAKGGTVTVDASTGRYVYTPSAAARHAAASEGATAADRQDSFTVIVSDGHGGAVPIVVTVPVAPVNALPTRPAAPPAATTDTVSGVVTGSIGVADADGDVLTYSAPSTTAKGGTVVVDPSTGQYAYTPSAAARHAAAATGASATTRIDTFTVTTSDGHGGTVAVTVSVPITPANAAPSAGSSSPGAPDATTGAVSGGLGAVDADGDTLTFATTTAPTKGTVTVDATGAYVYTPTGSARLTAARAAGPVTDTFTITASDGHGGTTPITVTVTVSPSVPPSNTVLTTIPVGDYPLDVAMSSDGSRAYVISNSRTNNVSVIDTATGTVITTLAVGQYPRAIKLSPDGAHAYVIDQGGVLSIIDTATNTVTSVAVAPNAAQMVLSPDGSRLYLQHIGGNTLTVIDTTTGTVIATPPVGQVVTGMLTSPDGRRLYVTTITNGYNVLVFDTSTNSLLQTIPIGGGAMRDMAISPDGTRVYIANNNTGQVLVVDTTTGTVASALVDVGLGAGDLQLSADGRRLYIANSQTGVVTVYNTTSKSVIATIPTGTPRTSAPPTITLSPDGRLAYVNNGGAGTVTVFDTTTNTVIATVPVGTTPGRLVLTPDGSQAYVVNIDSDTVSAIYTAPDPVLVIS